MYREDIERINKEWQNIFCVCCVIIRIGENLKFKRRWSEDPN